MRWVFRLVIGLLSVQCALAQPPDTLRIAPCRLASLSVAVDVSPAIRWVERRFDDMTFADIIAWEDLRELAKVGEAIAPDPLADFAAIAVAIGDSARSFDLFRQGICATYPAFDCEYDFDLELMAMAFSIARSISMTTERSMIVIAPRAGSSTDSVPILVTFTTPDKVVIDTLWILDDTVRMTLQDGVGSRRRLPLVVRRSLAPWTTSTDSSRIARWRDDADIGSASLHRLPLNGAFHRAFADLRFTSIERMIESQYMPYWEGISERIYFTLLDSLVTDPPLTSNAVTAFLEHLLCRRYSEFDCEYDLDFSGTPIADSIRAILPHYLALPDRIYAVVDDEGAITLLAFLVDTSRAAPVIITRKEIDAALGVRGGHWHDRLMRSIREEECWAEKMEGF